MRLDHIAYRVADRQKAVQFFRGAFKYRIADEFRIDFDNGSVAECYALEPPEKRPKPIFNKTRMNAFFGPYSNHLFHLAPEIFISDGTPDSIVGRWVAKRGGIGGIHHLAYEVEDVHAEMVRWRQNGWAEFTTLGPIRNTENLVQCFTKPHPITGVVYEFIKRGSDNKGFNIENVRDLMESTNE